MGLRGDRNSQASPPPRSPVGNSTPETERGGGGWVQRGNWLVRFPPPPLLTKWGNKRLQYDRGGRRCLWRGLRSRGSRVVKWLASKLDLGWRAERVPLNKSTICVESTLFPWIEGRAEFMIPFFCVETTAAFCKNRLAES